MQHCLNLSYDSVALKSNNQNLEIQLENCLKSNNYRYLLL